MKPTLVILAVLATGGAAQAELPPLECHDDGLGGYNVNWHGGGFVLYDGAYTHRDYQLTLEDCAGDRALRMVLPFSGDDLNDKWDRDAQFYDVIETALNAKRSYTMGQIAGLARENGARTKMLSLGYESCACDTYGAVTP